MKNTLSENGGVTRGICTVEDNRLVSITETRNIIKTPNGARANGKELDIESIVAMNFWCYPHHFLDVLKDTFPTFLSTLNDPMKDEYLLPIIADHMLKTGTEYCVLPTKTKWFGVTYIQDKPSVVENLLRLRDLGVYKEDLYSDLVVSA